MRLEDANVVPTSVRPGEKVDMKATYAVLSDNANNEVEITEVREITFNGELVGRPAVTVSHRGGTYTSTIPVYMPNDAKAGTYKVATTILTGNSKDTRETTFRVR